MAVVVALLCLPAAVDAEIYQWVDSQGGLHFSDTPDRTVRHLRKFHASDISVVRNPDLNMRLMNQRVPYEEVNGNMVVQGSVNGASVRFIVDTGASLVVVPPAVAKAAGLDTEGASMTKLQTANGTVRAPAVEIDRLNVAHLSMNRVKAVVLRASPNAHTGLLGMSFLSHYRMQVDHDNHLLILEQKR